MAIGFKKIIDELLDAIRRIEEISNNSYIRRKKKQERKDKRDFKQTTYKKKEIMNVEEEKILNKSNLIYVGKKSFRVIKDTGSYYNFVTTNLLKILDRKPRYLKNVITLYKCLHESFKIEKAIELEFELGKSQFKEVFYVMPKRKDETVILGRSFLENKKPITGIKQIKTPEEAIRILCEENKDGVKERLCKIYTQKKKSYRYTI